eukprot:Tbor_TRINITY_DN5696_c3_g2::TRINITY_DN5696_c3_g2_i2::g.9182::m.9182/K06691/RPN13; 26S proteasome regulatory subunit N13
MLAPSKISGRNPLLQFRAGKMTYSAGMVTPEKAKGVLSVVQSSSGMIEFIWSGFGSNEWDPPILVTAGDATFNRVDKCTSGRVFVLRLGTGSSNPQHCRFFWMQETSTERDEEIMKKIKKLIGDNGATTARAPVAVQGSAAASSSPPATGAPISAEAFRQMLANVSRGQVRAPIPPVRPPPDDVNLQALLASDAVLAALREDPEYYMDRLASHLPANHSSDIISEIRNPQASSGAAQLQAALSTSFKEVTTAFGIGSDDGQVGSTVFVNRIIANAESVSEETKEKDVNKEED